MNHHCNYFYCGKVLPVGKHFYCSDACEKANKLLNKQIDKHMGKKEKCGYCQHDMDGKVYTHKGEKFCCLNCKQRRIEDIKSRV